MTVTCILNTTSEGRLTLNKKYKVIKETGNFYVIQDDIQHGSWYKQRFIIDEDKLILNKNIVVL